MVVEGQVKVKSVRFLDESTSEGGSEKDEESSRRELGYRPYAYKVTPI